MVMIWNTVVWVYFGFKNKKTALTTKTEVSAVSFALDVNLEYTLSLRRQKPQKRKNRVGFQIILQNVNEVQTMGLLL